MSYISMYRDNYLKDNVLEYMYINHTGKFVKYIESINYGDRVVDITEEQLKGSVEEYNKKGDILSINTMEAHLNALKDFFGYLFKKGIANNIFKDIKDYNEFRAQIIEHNHLVEGHARGYLEQDTVKSLLDYFNFSKNNKKYVNMVMINFFFKITLLIPAKKKVISNLKVGDFSDNFDSIKVNGITVKLPRALTNDIIGEISKLDREISKDDIFLKLFFNSGAYIETVFNTPFYYALKESGYDVSECKSASFSVECIRNTGIINLAMNGTDIYSIRILSGISLGSLDKILKEYVPNYKKIEDMNIKINKEICQLDYYSSI